MGKAREDEGGGERAGVLVCKSQCIYNMLPELMLLTAVQDGACAAV